MTDEAEDARASTAWCRPACDQPRRQVRGLLTAVRACPGIPGITMEIRVGEHSIGRVGVNPGGRRIVLKSLNVLFNQKRGCCLDADIEKAIEAALGLPEPGAPLLADHHNRFTGASPLETR